MAEIERLSIALPAPMADAVRRAVEDGEYASASEVIRDALRLWESRRDLRERDIEIVRRRWDEGKASGRAGPLDVKRIMAEERAKLKVPGAVVAELLTTRRAEEELRQIWRHIATANPAAADRLLLRIGDKLQLLRDFPGIGTLRDDIRPGLRMLVEGNYLLLYEHDAANDAVELISVIDGRRDLSTLF